MPTREADEMPYQYLLCRSTTGLAVHLSTAHTVVALCGREAPVLELHVPFELNGCVRCAATALKAGTTHVIDVDGERVELSGFKPFGHR